MQTPHFSTLSSLSIQSVRELMVQSTASPSVLNLIQREMNGGTVTRDQIAALDDLPEVSVLRVSGLSNANLEYLASRHPQKFSVLELWKCPQLSDLSPIEELGSLTHVLMYHNRKVNRLWDFRKTPLLFGLDFSDFTKLDNLQDLATAHSLRELEFGNMLWNRAQYLSLDPLASLRELKRLSFNATVIADGRIQALAELVKLTELWFPSELFSREQLAWLRARLPSSLHSEVLESHQTRAAMPTRAGRTNDAKVNGKGERAFDSKIDTELLATKAREFQLLVQRFTADPLLEPLP